MSTPLYKRMKQRGSTFYAFPSTKHHTNPNFSKFVLLNIPKRESGNVLDFDDLESFGIYSDRTMPTELYADELVESLRNYVANQDTVFLESKISSRKEFYNIQEPKTPTEKIFWKWLKKMRSIDLEPAVHKVDWDKNLPDFDNPYEDTTTNSDYFRRYLWKEREPIDYLITSVTEKGGGEYDIFIEYTARFKKGDYVYIHGTDTGSFLDETPYEIINVLYENNNTTITIKTDGIVGEQVLTESYVKLKYHRLVQYIGEINVKSDVVTASKNQSEVIAYIPHQAGKTPTVLFKINDDTNYYPGLKLPLLVEEIQSEIKGAENYLSPIRQNPTDYPGGYYAQFDDDTKTYNTSFGDKVRLSGEYYGIVLNNNVGLSSNDYIEKLSDFRSDNLDGLTLDFDLNHYLKMQIIDDQVGFNFDEFNQMPIDDNPPEDFEYNAILWYYDTEIEGRIVSNLYGVTFLNNPNDDDDNDSDHISTYGKLVSKNGQDGISYQHVLNITTTIDNDTRSLSFDPLSLNNTFGFDLYSNVMSNVGKLTESFINIINEHIRLNDEVNNMKSVIYTQTDLDLIKYKLKNIENLLRLYSTFQFKDSETIKINTDYNDIYPTMSFDAKNIEYENIMNIKSSDIYNYMIATYSDMVINVPNSGKVLLNITNDDTINFSNETEFNILFDKDLKYKQGIEIILSAKDAQYTNKLNFYINYNDGSGNGSSRTSVLNGVHLPIDIGNVIQGQTIYHRNKFINNSLMQNVVSIQNISVDGGLNRTRLNISSNLFGNSQYSEYVYISDFVFRTTNDDIIDKSGMYLIDTNDFGSNYIVIDLDYINIGDPINIPKVYSYKKLKINILRIHESDISSLEERYLIEKTFI